MKGSIKLCRKQFISNATHSHRWTVFNEFGTNDKVLVCVWYVYETYNNALIFSLYADVAISTSSLIASPSA